MKENIIQSLLIMGKGMLAIFIVVLIVTAVVYILNAVDKRLAADKRKKGGTPDGGGTEGAAEE